MLEGEAGVGKTELAKVLAIALQKPLVRLQCYEGLDTSSAVYEWNYPRRMIEIHGLRVGEDIDIEITGLKPGEKLTEDLVDTNEQVRPCVEHISEIAVKPDARVAGLDLTSLISAAERDDRDRVVEEITRAVATIRGDGRRAVKRTDAA